MPEKPNSYDAIIVGAGPSGLNCAIRLADAGLYTLVIDKETFPREKVCGDALSDKVISNLKSLPKPIYDSFRKLENKIPCTGIKFISPGFTELNVPYNIWDCFLVVKAKTLLIKMKKPCFFQDNS